MTSSAVRVLTIVTGRWRENCFLLADEAGRAAIIDPGDDASRIIDVIEREALRPEVIIATHGHHDHVGASAELQTRYDVPMCLNDGDAPLLTRVNFYRLLFDKAPAVTLPRVDRWVRDADVIKVGTFELRIIATPGHTVGGISLMLDGLVFSGDVLLSGKIGRTDLPGGERATLLRSLAELTRLPPETRLLPGHGRATTIGDELANNAELREALDATAH